MKQSVTRFTRRFGVSIGMGIIVVAFMAVLVLQAYATSQLQAQVTAQEHIIGQINGVTTQISEAAKQRTTQINDLNSHIDCIAKFFTVANRTYVTIEDIDSCTLKNNATGEVSPTTPSSMTIQVQSTPTTQVNTTPVTTGSSTTPSAQNTTSTAAQSPGLIDRTAGGLTSDVKGLLNAL